MTNPNADSLKPNPWPDGERVAIKKRPTIVINAANRPDDASFPEALQGDVAESATDLYLDLMKRCLLNEIYDDPGFIPKTGETRRSRRARLRGMDWPTQAMTMIGRTRLDNIQSCVEDVLRNNVPGDLIEAGVWRGGATILMRAILRVWNVRDRRVWVADSFEGLPAPGPSSPPDEKCDDLHEFAQLAVSLEQVQENFSRFNLLDDQVAFLKGWFCDTLSKAPIEQLAVIRLDGDMYESTLDGLNSLYPRLSVGGYVIIDDYWLLEACRQAVHDYRQTHGIVEEIQRVDWNAAYWRREDP